MIELQHLEFSYPGAPFRLAVDALSVAQGENLAIVGPSGSGKTTLLNLLAGILVPNLGSLRFGQTDISQLNDSARRDFRISNIGMVFQQFELLDYLNVIDNVRLPFLINSSLPAAPRTRPGDLLKSVGMHEFAKRYPHELSRGEQQRVAICRALVAAPKLILADEPTGNLDPANKRKIMDLLFEQTDSREQTLVVVTHDHSLLSDFDRVIDFEEFLQHDVQSAASEATSS